MTPVLSLLAYTLGLAAVGFFTALAALHVVARQGQARPAPDRPQPEVAFLFQGEDLLDATETGQRLLAAAGARDGGLSALLAVLEPQFPGLRGAAETVGPAGTKVLASADGLSRLALERGATGLRLRLDETEAAARLPVPDHHSLAVLSDEVAMHRAIAAGTPLPVWRQSARGHISWANAEYRRLAGLASSDPSPSGALRALFETDRILSGGAGSVHRARLDLPRMAEPRWFEFSVTPLGADLLFTAIPVDRVVRAERSLNDFVQTLTQTFAHLNVGLAVFSRQRDLALFNPALTDLLGLSPEFLISRPTLFQVFDRLREKRMVPEPKDYKSWRRQMSALEAEAADGIYSETWSLVDGRTFRVTGRPHPESAVAFLFEDISAEIALERRFRAELKVGQAVIDGLEEALGVFSPSGGLIMSNRAYAALWYDAPARVPDMLSFVDATRVWQENCLPTPAWGDARDFAATIGERSNWTAEVRMRDGRRLACRFETLPGGCTLAGFCEIRAAAVLPLRRQGGSVGA